MIALHREAPLIEVGVPVKGLAHQGSVLSIPKQVPGPRDLAPPEKQSKVHTGPYNTMGRDGAHPKSSVSPPIDHGSWVGTDGSVAPSYRQKKLGDQVR
jgi:hypothetical protein